MHANGIVFCDFKPGNILMDEYSKLKLCDFALCKKVIDLVEEEGQSAKTGSPYYMAPELFDQRGVFSFASDVYGLGVVLYELACGKPPFSSDNFTSLAKEICEGNIAPLTNVTPQCADFIHRMLEKNPAQRPRWEEIMNHEWWDGIIFTQYQYPEEPHFENYLKEKGLNLVMDSLPDMKESKMEKSVVGEEHLLRMSMNVKKNLGKENGEIGNDGNSDQQIKIQKDMTITLGQIDEYVSNQHTEEASKSMERPVSIENKSRAGQSTKSIPKSPKSREGSPRLDQASPLGEIAEPRELEHRARRFLELLIIPSDKSVKPIIGNTEIEKIEEFEWTSPLDGIELVSGNTLASLEKEELETYLLRIYKFATSSTSTKDRLCLLNYFVGVVQIPANANTLLGSLFMDLFTKMLKSVKTKPFKITLCTLLGLTLRHATNYLNDLPHLGLAPALLDLAKDPSVEVRRRAVAALGELLFYGADQVEDTEEGRAWLVSQPTAAFLLKILKSNNEDEILKHYALKTIENILCKSQPGGAAEPFCTDIFCSTILDLHRNAKTQILRNSTTVCLSSMCHLSPRYAVPVVSKLTLRYILSIISDSDKKGQQSLLNLIALYLIYGGEDTVRETLDEMKFVLTHLSALCEHGASAVKAKALIIYSILIHHEPLSVISPGAEKIIQSLEKIAGDKSKNLKIALKELVLVLEEILELCLNELDASDNQKGDDEDQNAQVGDGSSSGDFLSLILTILRSFYIQSCLLTEDRILRVFDLAPKLEIYFTQGAAGSTCSGLIAAILEEVLSNRRLICHNQEILATHALPILSLGFDSNNEEGKLSSVKWTQALLQQVVPEDITESIAVAVHRFGKEIFFPRFKHLAGEPNPLGTASIKLGRTLLDFDEQLTDLLFVHKVAPTILSFLTLNHEKCNPNTTKVVSHIVNSPLQKLKPLADEGLLERSVNVLAMISDPVQGEEIVELILVFYRRLFREVKVETFQQEMVKQVEELLLAKERDVSFAWKGSSDTTSDCKKQNSRASKTRSHSSRRTSGSSSYN